MEKLNDLFKDTKQSLDEKCSILSQTQKKLTTTETNLSVAKQECEESKFIIEEKTNTESLLFQQAQDLQKINAAADMDCSSLHSKINRINEVAKKNKSLTELFSKQMTEKLLSILKHETEASNEHKNDLCGLCNKLTEAENKLTEMKSDILCEFFVYNEEQQKWLNDLSTSLKTEIEENCSQFYQSFINSIDSSQNRLKSSCENHLKLCSNHEQLFVDTYAEISNQFGELEANSSEFTVSFTHKSAEYLASNIEEIETASSNSTASLQKLLSSTEKLQKDVCELKTSQEAFQANCFESLDSLQAQFVSSILQISDRFKQSFQSLDNKCKELSADASLNMNELAQMRDLIKLNEKDSIANRNSQFKSLVTQPVQQFLEANSDCFKKLHISSQILQSNFQSNKEKLDQSSNTIAIVTIIFSIIKYSDRTKFSSFFAIKFQNEIQI